jgi:hypothetical protein
VSLPPRWRISPVLPWRSISPGRLNWQSRAAGHEETTMPTRRSKPESGADAGATPVDTFIADLQHPAKSELIALRQIILGVDSAITEGIKWNAPSFRTRDDFATFHLREKQGLALILHFGAKKNAITQTGVAIADPAGLLQWLGKDRAIVRFADLAEVASRREALVALLREWIRHV